MIVTCGGNLHWPHPEVRGLDGGVLEAAEQASWFETREDALLTMRQRRCRHRSTYAIFSSTPVTWR